MSAPTRSRRRTQFAVGESVDLPRTVALGGVALLTVAYFSVLYHFIDVTGNPLVLVVEAAATLAVATYLSTRLRVRTAAVVSVALLAVGLTLYVYSLPHQPPIVPLAADAIALATGRSLLKVANVDLWVLGVAPGPIFLTWYLGLRRRYVSAALVGGATLTFLVLTSDAGSVRALLGVVGGATAIGVGDIERRGDDIAAAEPLAILLALMILLPTFVAVVPGGPSRTATGLSGFGTGAGDAGTVEASLVDTDNRIGIQGNISLSPEVRFRVESDESAYWQVGTFDRYTGEGWIRTGSSRSYGGRTLDGPPGESREMTQDVTALDDLSVVPSAWKPVSASGDFGDGLRVTEKDGFTIDGSLSVNDTYTVTSETPVADAKSLRNASGDYPEGVEQRYTRIPSSTPDRVAERAARITANADNAYDTARIVERWLQNNKEYSLDVERPDGNIADAFLFEMDAGYCTYFATTMVTMLRSQDIPARFAVGYTPGERVDRDEWVVRGYNAHAWVQVYFPDVGWVKFDPTPSDARQQAEQAQLSQARERNATGADTNDTGGTEWTSTPTQTPAPLTPPGEQAFRPEPTQSGPQLITPPDGIPGRPTSSVNGTVAGFNATTGAPGGDGGDSGDSGDGVELPSREEVTLLGIAFFGLALGVRRLGLPSRVYRAIWLRYQPKSDPPTDAERAYERLEYLLEKRYRPREPGETPRQYLAAIGADERANTVATIRERARYAGEITREEADEAMALVDDIVAR